METPPEDMPKRVDTTVAPERPRPIPPGSNLPALSRAPPSRGWLGWAFLGAVIVALVAGTYLGRERIVAAWPEAARLYDAVGLGAATREEAFELREVKQSTFVEGEHTVIVISGEIVNVSARQRPTPKVIARIFDDQDNVLTEWMFEPVRAELGPGEATEFTDRFTDPPAEAVNLVVSLARDN